MSVISLGLYNMNPNLRCPDTTVTAIHNIIGLGIQILTTYPIESVESLDSILAMRTVDIALKEEEEEKKKSTPSIQVGLNFSLLVVILILFTAAAAAVPLLYVVAAIAFRKHISRHLKAREPVRALGDARTVQIRTVRFICTDGKVCMIPRDHNKLHKITTKGDKPTYKKSD